jgi:hypothetical protein
MTVLCPSCTLRLHLMHPRSFASASLATPESTDETAHSALPCRALLRLHAQLRFSVLCDSLKLCIDGIPQPQHKYHQTRSCHRSKSMPRPSIVGPHNVYARTPPFSARRAPEATRANARRSMRTVVEPRVQSSWNSSSDLLLKFFVAPSSVLPWHCEPSLDGTAVVQPVGGRRRLQPSATLSSSRYDYNLTIR